MVVDKELPVASAATEASSCTWADASTGLADGVKLIVATTPFESGVALGPHSKQVATPGKLLHDRDLFGKTLATVAAEKSCVEYWIVH